jgi:hypothetical protein
MAQISSDLIAPTDESSIQIANKSTDLSFK